MTGLLASVRSAAEAAIALAGGADLVDLKEPAQGALGRLPEDAIRAILAQVAARRPVSATIGDMPLSPEPVRDAVAAMAAAGVDIVKVGFFDGAVAAALAALAPLAAEGVRLVAVLFADRAPDLALVDRCAETGFLGVMLDTADKRAGPLTRHIGETALAAFVARARRHRLLVGLAGSLSTAEIPALLPLAPDYLGFRSALAMGPRDGPLDRDAVARIKALLGHAPALPDLRRASAALPPPPARRSRPWR